MQRRLPRLMATALPLTALLLALPVKADPYFHHSAGACRPATSTDAGRIQYLSSYGVRNDSSSSARVHCAVDFNNVGKVAWGVYVAVIDRHPTQDITCHLYMFNEGGTQLSHLQLSSDPFYGPDEPQQLAFFPPSMGLNVFYNLRCDLPPTSVNGASHILTYQTLL
jgi:hypothetical protein